MSIIPTSGISPGMADMARATQELAADRRAVAAAERADRAAGVSAADGDHLVDDRDPDGRRPWLLTPRKANENEPERAAEREPLASAEGHIDLLA